MGYVNRIKVFSEGFAVEAYCAVACNNRQAVSYTKRCPFLYVDVMYDHNDNGNDYVYLCDLHTGELFAEVRTTYHMPIREAVEFLLKNMATRC